MKRRAIRIKPWRLVNAERLGRLLDARVAMEDAERAVRKAVRRLNIVGYNGTALKIRVRVLEELKVQRHGVAVQHGSALREARRLGMKICKCGFALSDQPCSNCHGSGRLGHEWNGKKEKCWGCCGTGKRGIPSRRWPNHLVEGVKML